MGADHFRIIGVTGVGKNGTKSCPVSTKHIKGEAMKPRIVWMILAILVGGVLSYVAAQTSNQNTAKQQSVTVEMMNGQGQSVGTATLTSMGNNKGGVRIKLDL